MNPRQHAVALLEFTRKISNDILNGITDDKLTHQPSPTDNHALWVMGHLAATDAWMASTLNRINPSGSSVNERAITASVERP